LKLPFPWVALGVGLLIALVLSLSGALQRTDVPNLPLLTQLIVAEFGFFVTAFGATLGIRARLAGNAGASLLIAAAGCAVLALGFLVLGIQLWPHGGIH